MRKLIYTLLVVVSGSAALSQQEYTYTFFGENTTFFNPAATGTKSFGTLTGNFRKQWVGFDGSPTSGGVTYEMPIKNKNMGVGGMIYQDHVGVTNQTNIAGLYSYQLKLNDKSKFSFGVNAGIDIVNTKFDKLIYWDENDNVFAHDYVNVLVPHIGFGVYYYTDKLYVGLSVPRIISMNSNQFNSISYANAPSLVSHYYLSAGYKVKLNKDFNLKPSLLVKYTSVVLPQVDISVATFYKDIVGLGVSYKSFGFASTFIQYNYYDAIVFGYAFDFSLGPIQKYSKGSHEILLQYRFNVKKKEIKNAPSIN